MGLLNISDLKVHFETDDGIVRANDIIQLEIQENEIIGLIGETGCGKTILGHAMVRLLPDNAKVSGNICYKNKNLLKLTENEMRQIRGNEIAIIFQNPYLSLNPVLTIEEQIAEIYQYRLGIKEGEIKGKVSEVLEMVSVDPGRKAEYPHQFSGGMIQRVMIAMAIVFNPEFLIADEITKGLDTPVKWKVINLIKNIIKHRSMLLITHDLDVAQNICDRIAVMYAGELVEINKTNNLFDHPKHPYTRGLLKSLPSNGFHPIPGQTPSLSMLPEGCRFHPRCSDRKTICSENHPQMKKIKTDCYVRCFNGNGPS